MKGEITKRKYVTSYIKKKDRISIVYENKGTLNYYY